MRRLATVALALPAAQAAYAAVYRRLLRRMVAGLMEGDIEGFVRFYADDATLTFPGDNSWGPVYRGKHEIRGFLERFLRVGLRGEVGDIAVVGPPWNTTVFVRFDDRARGRDGSLVYENEAVVVIKGRWGKVVSETIFEDTEKVAAFDRYLASVDEPLAAAAG